MYGKHHSITRAGIQCTPPLQRACRSSHSTEQSTGLSARLIHADNQPISRADTGNKAGCLTLIYGGRAALARLCAPCSARAYVEKPFLNRTLPACLLNNMPIKQQ